MLPRIGMRLGRNVCKDGMSILRSTITRPRTFPLDKAASRRGMALVVKPQVIEQIDTQVSEYPHVDALKMWTEDGEAHLWTYKQLQRQVDAFANGLLEHSFKPKHKLVVWAKDCCEGIVTQMGGIKAGIQVEVLDAKATDEDLKKALTGSRGFLISPTLLPNAESMDTLYRVIPELEQYGRVGEQIVNSEDFPTLRWVWTMGFDNYEGMNRFEHLLLYMEPPYKSHVEAEAPSLGSLEASGTGDFVELTLPYIDPEVKLTQEFEDD